MCVIAGYIGTRRAAPVLLEMIERQEGLAGGFYTGLATVDTGRLHWRKVVGDLSELRKCPDAQDLPGCVGVAHSRSNSGGGVEWAHPFVSCDDRVAYIANGAAGVWKTDRRCTDVPRRLAEAGHRFRAVLPHPVGSYPVLADGSCVHMSDAMAHLVEEALRRTGDPEQAIASAFLDMPAEIVALYVTPLHPDAVYGARVNMPACVAIDGTGAYVASSPEGFPAHVRWWTWVPPSSVFSVAPARLNLAPLGDATQAMVDDVDRVAARAALMQALEQASALPVADLLKAIDPLARGDGPRVRHDAVYEILHDLVRIGLVRRRVERVPGAAAGVAGVRFLHELVR